MKIGISRHQSNGDYAPVQIYYNVPEDGSYLKFLEEMDINHHDQIWVDKNKQICMPCRLRRMITYQFGLQGVEIHEFED